MKIIIDQDILEDKDITIEQYYFLALIHFNKLNSLIRYVEKFGEFKVSMIEDLKTKGFLKFQEFKGDISSLIVTDITRELIQSLEVSNQIVEIDIKEKQFDEILNIYPKKTNNGRRLQSNVNGATKEKFMKIYFKNLLLTKCTHEQVVQAIKNEIASRKTNNSTDFFTMLSTYLNQASWMGFIGEVTVVQTSGHLKAL